MRSFVAELPGVGAALSAAFAATAVLFIIEALAQGVEKLQAWAEQAHKIALGWDEFNTAVLTSFDGLDQKLLEAGIKMDELRGDHVAALKKEIELIDHVSLSELEHEFTLLAKAADAMLAHLTTSWYELSSGSKGAQNALEDFKAEYDLLLAQGKDKEASDLLAGTLKSATAVLDKLNEAKTAAEELNTVEGQTGVEGQTYRPNEKELQAQQIFVDALNAQVTAQAKINELAKDDTSIKRMEEQNRLAVEADKAFKEQAQEAKQAADQEEKAWEQGYKEAVSKLQESEKLKIAATREGSQERIAATLRLRAGRPPRVVGSSHAELRGA